MSISQPAKLPVWGLIVPFIFLYFALRYTVQATFERSGRAKKSTNTLEKWLPMVVAASVVIVLALQSIGQLTFRDVIAVVLVVMLGYFYVHRNSSKQNK